MWWKMVTSMASVAMPVASKRGGMSGVRRADPGGRELPGGHPDLPIRDMGSAAHGRARPMPV